MSFFSKMTKEFEGLLDKKEKPQASAEVHRGNENAPSGYQPQQQQYSDPQYGMPPPGAPYGAPPPSQYHSPAPGVPYGAPPPVGVPGIPNLPQGWTGLWDPAGQRWAYLELSTSKVIWNMPTAPSYPQPGFDGQRGFEGAGYGHGAQMYGQEGHADPKKDKKNMMMGAAGGLAVGAVGGMVLANAMDDDDHHASGGGYTGGQDQGGYPPPGQELPDETASGSSVSSSDKEDVEEAREEYEEAYEETYGSD